MLFFEIKITPRRAGTVIYFRRCSGPCAMRSQGPHSQRCYKSARRQWGEGDGDREGGSDRARDIRHLCITHFPSCKNKIRPRHGIPSLILVVIMLAVSSLGQGRETNHEQNDDQYQRRNSGSGSDLSFAQKKMSKTRSKMLGDLGTKGDARQR